VSLWFNPTINNAPGMARKATVPDGTNFRFRTLDEREFSAAGDRMAARRRSPSRSDAAVAECLGDVDASDIPDGSLGWVFRAY
jgi:hypothetical protein